MFTAFGGARDALFVGTRDAGADNALVALDPGDGTEIGRFDNGGPAANAGSGSSAAPRPWTTPASASTSRATPGGSANTLWCLEIDDVVAEPRLQALLWARTTSGASRAARSSAATASTWRNDLRHALLDRRERGARASTAP